MAFLYPFVYPLLIWKSRRVGILALVIYLACYLPFGAQGRYILSNHGGRDWRNRWCPDHLVERVVVVRSHAVHTILGAIFWPCIEIDRAVWHRDRDVVWSSRR